MVWSEQVLVFHQARDRIDAQELGFDFWFLPNHPNIFFQLFLYELTG